MSIFPSFGPTYYEEKDRSILTRMETFYAESITINQQFWGEADTDTRFEAGDQTLWNDIYGNLPANRRRQFNFNRIRRVKNMIGGHQRRNRKSTVVIPIESGDEQTADQLSKVLIWQNNQAGVLETISSAFDGALVTGMNLLQVWMDYRADPLSGDIRVDNCSYNSFLIDPFFRKPDLSDCNGIWKRTFVTKRECLSLLPNYADQIMQLVGIDSRDGKFQFMPESYNFSVYNLLSYDEYYYRDYRMAKMVVDTKTSKSVEWTSENAEGLRHMLKLYPQLTLIEHEVPTVRLAIVVQGKVMYDGPQPSGIDVYPFVPVLGYYQPQLAYFPLRIQGIVRGLRDAQFLYNRRRVIELDILESQINSGWKFKENALVNPEHVYLEGQGRGLALKEEASMADVEKIQPAQIPPSMLQLSELLGKEIQEISGVNEELLGSATDEKAGILSMLRQGAGLTTLQILFDQLDYAQKTLGNIMIKMIQNNFTPGKVERIIGEPAAESFYDKAFGKYDSVVEEGLNTSTQKQMQFAQLLHLREVGVPIPDEALLEAATIQDKKKIIDLVKAQQQQQQEEKQKQDQIQMANLEAQTKLAEAQATADAGLGLERLSRIDENKALAEERRAEAVKDRELGTLHLVKALKEIETVDLKQVEKIIALAMMVRNEEQKTSRSQTQQQREQQATNMQAMRGLG